VPRVVLFGRLPIADSSERRPLLAIMTPRPRASYGAEADRGIHGWHALSGDPAAEQDDVAGGRWRSKYQRRSPTTEFRWVPLSLFAPSDSALGASGALRWTVVRAVHMRDGSERSFSR
jgi:hypothetical protein